MKMKMKNRNAEMKTAALPLSLHRCFGFYLHNALGVYFIFTHCTHLITYMNRRIFVYCCYYCARQLLSIQPLGWKFSNCFTYKNFVAFYQVMHDIVCCYFSSRTHTHTLIHFMLLLFENYIAHDNGPVFSACTTYPRNVCWVSTRTARSHSLTHMHTNACMHIIMSAYCVTHRHN